MITERPESKRPKIMGIIRARADKALGRAKLLKLQANCALLPPKVKRRKRVDRALAAARALSEAIR